MASQKAAATPQPIEESASSLQESTRLLQAELPHLDRLIHERLRLGIVSALASSPTLTFSRLKEILQTTDGNLSRHARKLEDAGYIECSKSFDGRVPRSDFRLTAEGREALRSYLNHMEALIRAARTNVSA